MTYLLIEDDPRRHDFFIRNLPEDQLMVAQSVDIALEMLHSDSLRFDGIFFDNDLGKAGYKWEGQSVANRIACDFRTKEPYIETIRFAIIHSMNPTAAERMYHDLRGVIPQVYVHPFSLMLEEGSVFP